MRYVRLPFTGSPAPAQHAMFLEHVSQLNIQLDRDTAVQTIFDIM